MESENVRLTWQAHEYEWKERSVDWFWTVGLVGVAGGPDKLGVVLAAPLVGTGDAPAAARGGLAQAVRAEARHPCLLPPCIPGRTVPAESPHQSGSYSRLRPRYS